MKVAFLSRENLFSGPGGDTIHIVETANALEELGCQVSILSSSSFKGKENSFDIIHFFNLTRPADLLPHLDKITCPIVVSPIYVDYSEADSKARKGLGALVRKLLGKNTFELVKVAARILKGNERNLSWMYFVKGYKGAILQILKRTNTMMPNSHSEMNRFRVDFPDCDLSYTAIPNGINVEFLQTIEKKPKENLVVCAARFERLKNQLSLIEATRGMDVKLLLIGKPSPNQADYYKLCQAAAHENVEFIHHLPQQELFEILSSAKVHAMASWFETTGLISLEAAYLDCSLVTSRKGDQSEYFSDCAHFCEPDDIDSIRLAIRNALIDKPCTLLKEKIEKEYNWKNAAKISLDVYEQEVRKGAKR